MRKNRYSAEEVAHALQVCNGNQSAAAGLLRCTRQTVSSYANRYPQVRQALKDSEQAMVDEGVAALRRAVRDGKWPAVRYLLSTLGQSRGYGEPGARTQAGPDRERLDKEFIAVIEKVYGRG